MSCVTHRLLPLALLCATLAAAPLPTRADALADAFAAGQVGERPDGLIGAVAAPSPAVQALVERINGERLARYRDIAARNGRSLAEIQALAGRRLTEAAGDGRYVMDAGGRWQRQGR